MLQLARRAPASHALQLGEAAGRMLVALPLAAGGAPLGVLVLTRGTHRPPFSDRDVARIYERDVAQALQASLLSDAPPDDPRMRIASFYGPAVHGGDWYDAFMPAPDRVSLVVGDIVGQGLEAASAMGRLRSAVRAFAVAGARPGLLLEQIDAFAALDPATRMATLVYVEIDLETRILQMASAGHPPVVLIDPAARPRLVWEGRSPPLGVYPDATARPDTCFVIVPGARLILYTDGLVERREHPLDVGFAVSSRLPPSDASTPWTSWSTASCRLCSQTSRPATTSACWRST